jgi:hypothetical protein
MRKITMEIQKSLGPTCPKLEEKIKQARLKQLAAKIKIRRIVDEQRS